MKGSQALPTFSQVEADGYMLGAGDRVRIDFFNVSEFSAEYQVLPNGTVNFPRIGAVPVQGLTLRQASSRITDRFSSYLQRPIVTISLISGRPLTIAIAGEVNRPGAYTLAPISKSNLDNSEVEPPTLTRLLQLADGVTQSADLQHIEIRRAHPYGLGAREVYVVNLWELLKSGEVTQDVRLRDGDSVFIPATQSVDLANARQLTAANFATRSNRPLNIAVIGEVTRPGPYTIIEGSQQATDRDATPNSLTPTVTKAIQIAGGITQMADLRNIQVRRLTRAGYEQVIDVNFWELLQSGDVLQDLPLQDGDRIVVGRAPSVNDAEVTQIASASFSPDRITVNIVGEVERPGVVTVPPNTPLNQAILSAGGFNARRAKSRSVTLVRLETNGTVSRRDIAINLGQGVNAQNNPSLRNGDTVVVHRSGLASVTDTAAMLTAPFAPVLSILGWFDLFR
jgi:polysaccharide export outer membrane protein